MAPTEEKILSTFLLPPAPLQSIISLKAFTALFPRAQQSSPQIKVLYRDLQRQRAHVTDTIGHNVAVETKRGIAQRRAVVKARKELDKAEQDEEVQVEKLMVGQISNLPRINPHTLMSLLPELEKAAEDIEDEIRQLDAESDALLADMQNTVGGLSDLRHGRFANAQLREQILEDLGRLEASCEN